MKDFNLNIEKAKATILYITKQFGEVDFLKVFKILYFAEREHLAIYGRPIVGDTYIAMKRGPVPSFIYDLLKFLRGDGFYNSNYDIFINSFKIRNKFLITANENPDLEELSVSDLSCLNKSISENKDLDFNTLSEKSHDSAWQNANVDDQINILNIAKAGGANSVLLQYIEESKDYNNIVFV